MKLKTLIFIFIFTIVSCKDKLKPIALTDKSVSTNMLYSKKFSDNEKIENLFNSVSNKGDTIAYKELESIYFLSGHRLDFLYVSITMSNKFKYNRAYYDVFTSLYRLNSKNDQSENWVFDNCTNPETLNFAIENLKRASDLGFKDAKKIIELYKKQKRYIRD